VDSKLDRNCVDRKKLARVYRASFISQTEEFEKNIYKYQKFPFHPKNNPKEEVWFIPQNF
jgi:hypothetical protein